MTRRGNTVPEAALCSKIQTIAALESIRKSRVGHIKNAQFFLYFERLKKFRGDICILHKTCCATRLADATQLPPQ